MALIKRRRGWTVKIGGDQHRGWLPENAATPPPEPICDVILDLQIESDPGGYLLVYAARDHSVYGDTWHASLAAAEAAAFEWFGVGGSDWETAEGDGE
jgi:hypothetical protein